MYRLFCSGDDFLGNPANLCSSGDVMFGKWCDSLDKKLECFLTSHKPSRMQGSWGTSGFKCEVCHKVGESYDSFDFGSGYIPLLRRKYSRKYGSITREQGY